MLWILKSSRSRFVHIKFNSTQWFHKTQKSLMLFKYSSISSLIFLHICCKFLFFVSFKVARAHEMGMWKVFTRHFVVHECVSMIIFSRVKYFAWIVQHDVRIIQFLSYHFGCISFITMRRDNLQGTKSLSFYECQPTSDI